MKAFVRFVALLSVVLATAAVMYGQATGDFRTRATGVWANIGTWQRFNGTTWVNATSVPDSNAGVTTILAGNTVTVDASNGVDQVVIAAGGTLIVGTTTTAGIVCTIGSGGITVSGALVDTGAIIASPGPYTITPVGVITVASGGMYRHGQDGGVMPAAVWQTGSTCMITGTVGAVTSIAGGGAQNFYNLVWNCPTQTSNCSLGMYGATIGGDVTCVTSNTGRFYFMAGNSGNVHINGSVNVQGGNLAMNGTSSFTQDTVFVGGNINVTGGMFSVTRGSQSGQTGCSVWRLLGNLSVTNATISNSNAANGKIFFDKQGVQTITMTNVTYGTGTGAPINLIVSSGSTVDFGTSNLGINAGNGSSGSFQLLSGGTLETADPNGVNGCITSTGASGGGNIFSTGGSYIFNGSANQVTGAQMPDTCANLTINNPGTVALSKATTTTGFVTLTAGTLDATSPNCLTRIAANVSGPGAITGCVLDLVTSAVNPLPGTGIPQSFFVSQNYPNPFNPSTVITYGIPKDAFVSAKVYDLLGREVAVLFSGHEHAGEHTLTFEAANLPSGVYFIKIQAGNSSGVRRMLLMK